MSEGRPLPGGPIAGSAGALVEGEGSGWSPPGWMVLACVALFGGGAALVWWRGRARRRRVAADPTTVAIEDLHRALRRSGRRIAPQTTLHGLATRFAGTGAEGYLHQLAASRYGTVAAPPDRSQRRGLRRALARDGGPLARLRSLWAVPPSAPSLRTLRGRRRADG